MGDAEFIADRCKRSLHHTEPIVRAALGDLVFAATCCDRIFTYKTDPIFGQLYLMELKVDQEKLAQLLQGPEWEKLSDG